MKYVSGAKARSCDEPVRACTGVAVGAQISLNDNPRAMAQCTQTVDVGCAKPAFGLHEEVSTIDVPDLGNATVSWSGGKIKPGSVKIDLTRGDLRAACTMKDVYVSKPGAVTRGHRDIQTGLCLAPQFGNLVANP